MTPLPYKDAVLGIILSLTQVPTFSSWFDETNSKAEDCQKNVCLKITPSLFKRCILYVDNFQMISLDRTAEHTRLCKMTGEKGLLVPSEQLTTGIMIKNKFCAEQTSLGQTGAIN